jgi:hypothetical protein
MAAKQEANQQRMEAEREAERQRMEQMMLYVQTLGTAMCQPPPPRLFALPLPPHATDPMSTPTS